MSVIYEINLDVITCSECGISFGMPGHFIQNRREDHNIFWCPNGHTQYFPSKSEAEVLREQLKKEQSKLANAQLEIMMKEKETKRLQKKIKNGVCPCCHRQFIQLTRHMKTKHPEYGDVK